MDVLIIYFSYVEKSAEAVVVPDIDAGLGNRDFC